MFKVNNKTTLKLIDVFFLSLYLTLNAFQKEYSEAYQTTPAGIYLLKYNNRNTRRRCEICSNLTLKTPERRHWRHSGVFIVNFEHISHIVLVFLLLTLNM